VWRVQRLLSVKRHSNTALAAANVSTVGAAVAVAVAAEQRRDAGGCSSPPPGTACLPHAPCTHGADRYPRPVRGAAGRVERCHPAEVDWHSTFMPATFLILTRCACAVARAPTASAHTTAVNYAPPPPPPPLLPNPAPDPPRNPLPSDEAELNWIHKLVNYTHQPVQYTHRSRQKTGIAVCFASPAPPAPLPRSSRS
jgi:hypothetical protein